MATHKVKQLPKSTVDDMITRTRVLVNVEVAADVLYTALQESRKLNVGQRRDTWESAIMDIEERVDGLRRLLDSISL